MLEQSDGLAYLHQTPPNTFCFITTRSVLFFEKTERDEILFISKQNHCFELCKRYHVLKKLRSKPRIFLYYFVSTCVVVSTLLCSILRRCNGGSNSGSPQSDASILLFYRARLIRLSEQNFDVRFWIYVITTIIFNWTWFIYA